MYIACAISVFLLIIMFLFDNDSSKYLHFIPIFSIFPFWRGLFLSWKIQEQTDKAIKWWLHKFTIKKFFREFWKWYFITLTWNISRENITIKEPIELDDFLWLKKNFKIWDKLSVFIDPKNSDNSYLDVNAVRRQNPNIAPIDKHEEDNYYILGLSPYQKYISIWGKIFLGIGLICLILIIVNYSKTWWIKNNGYNEFLITFILFWLMFGIFFTFIAKKIQIQKEKQK